MTEVAPPNFAAAVPGGVRQCTAMKVRKLARRVTQIYDEALAPYGLTVGQMGLLAALRRREGIAVGALAEQLSSDASTVSRLLKPLTFAGLVTLVTDPADGRARLVRLTDLGADKRRTAATGWEQAQERVREALGDGRLATLQFILDDAHSHL
jgi:DNA-binding MarR family transcriptional regulator